VTYCSSETPLRVRAILVGFLGDVRSFGLRDSLPHPAHIWTDHRLAGLAAPGLLKLRHVLEYAVGSESTRRMRIYVHQHPRVLRLPLLAPNPCKAQEITLFGRVSINFIGLLTGLLDLVLECHQRNSGAAIVGCVLPERQLSIQLQVIDGYEIAVLVRNTAGTLFKFLSVLLGPPIAQIALCIELAPLIVKAMRQLMSN